MAARFRLDTGSTAMVAPLASLVAAAFLAAALALPPSPAMAHSPLDRSVPADEAELDALPESFVLEFADPARLATVAIRQDGETLHRLRPDDRSARARFRLSPPDLAPGAYVLDWRALAEDGHVMQGRIRFVLSE